MEEPKTLNHSKCECKYHVVFIPKYAVLQIIGYIKVKAAIYIARHFGGRKKNFVGQHFGARGYFVSVVGRDETMIWSYRRNQQPDEIRLDQLKLLD